MFVQSEKFIEKHQGKVNDISIYGQESNQTTWRLAKMNLAIRDIDSSQVKWNNEGSFLNDAHKDLKAFSKISLQPGETKNIKFNLEMTQLAYYDEEQSDFIVEPLEYEAFIGAYSLDQNALRGSFRVSA